MEVLILDGYVDEPSCLGVPPYLSPYPRYVAGAVEDTGHSYSYLTVDQHRSGAELRGDLLVVIAGCLVPGRYLRGMPISDREIEGIAERFDGTKVLGGPLVRFGLQRKRHERMFDHLARKDLDACIHDLLDSGRFTDRDREAGEWREWAVAGAKVAKMHPDFPQPLITEIDMSRGCARYFTGGCSFCVEPKYGRPFYRDPGDVIDEIGELSKNGVTNFRLGGQACFFCYDSEDIGGTETPEPNVARIDELLKGIRRSSPRLRVLHTDNADPAVIAAHPEESTKVLKLIAKYCTSGNVLSFGMESADPKVIDENNLNARPEQVMKAIQLVNSVGAKRGPTGLPIVLPGINIISGLKGETEGTYGINLGFLKGVLDSGNLLRRINIRQVMEVRDKFPVRKHYREFREFKEKVREEVDRPMLGKVLPGRTVLKDVYMELSEGKTTFGRQIGTYPILVGLPYKTELNQFVDAKVLDHGFRSVTALEHPMDINKASLDALTALPGIGRKRAARIIRARPFVSRTEFMSALDDKDIAKQVLEYIYLG